MTVLAVALAAATALVMLTAVSAAISSVLRVESRRVRCPLVDRPVTVEAVQEIWSGRAVDVTTCSAFEPPADVACGKPCLTQPALRGVMHAVRDA